MYKRLVKKMYKAYGVTPYATDGDHESYFISITSFYLGILLFMLPPTVKPPYNHLRYYHFVLKNALQSPYRHYAPKTRRE